MSARATTATWLALVALTTGSYLFADGGMGMNPVLILFGFAAVKLLLIQAVFMELLGCRPLFLRLAIALDTLVIGMICIPFLF